MSRAIAAGLSAPRGDDLWGHPRQLWMLLGVTAWFNFVFYGFRAFLAPFLAMFWP